MNKALTLVFLAFLVLYLSSCSPRREVKRIETDQQVDLSGRWNDTDSRMVAEALMDQVLHARWLDEYTRRGARSGSSVLTGPSV